MTLSEPGRAEGSDGVSTTTLHVAHPWAWSWCPLPALPIVQAPDIEDGRARRYGHAGPEWARVAHAVVSAVSMGQRELTADLSRWAEVKVPGTLSVETARVAQSWLGLGEGVSWSLVEQPRIGNGRHRLWACRAIAGIAALPLRLDTLTALPDALIDFGDESYRQGMAAALLVDLSGIEATLTGRVDLATVNHLAVANAAAARSMLRRETALMTGEQWNAANA